jgi:Pro-kumamolisin, activation domain
LKARLFRFGSCCQKFKKKVKKRKPKKKNSFNFFVEDRKNICKKTMKTAIFVLLVCVGIAMADRVFLEGEEVRSVDGWQWVGAAPRDGLVHLTLMLKQRNMDELDSIFWAVSTPSSPRYGQYLTMDELVDLIAPEQDAVETVLAWLRIHGISEWTMPLTRDLITFSADVATAEKLLECKFWSFHYDNRVTAISSYGAYSVPEHIARHVAVVAGVTGFPLITRAQYEEIVEDSSRAAPNPTIGPANLRSAYGVPTGLVGTNKTNSFAVAEFQGQFYRYAFRSFFSFLFSFRFLLANLLLFFFFFCKPDGSCSIFQHVQLARCHRGWRRRRELAVEPRR